MCGPRVVSSCQWILRQTLCIALLGAAAFFASPAFAVTDSDGDGYPAGTDCDDRDPKVWAIPGEADDLHFTSPTTLIWSPRSNVLGGTLDSVHYDTLRSSSPSVFSSTPTASCNDPDGLSASTTDPAAPAPGHAFFYLVRLRNTCGSGSLGATSGGEPIAGIACDCTALCNDSNACTADRCSDGACVHDPLAAGILEPPQSVAACPGEDAHFSVRSVDDGTIQHFQWKKNGAPIGTDSPSLALAAAAGDNGAQITCTVTGGCASTTTAPATLTVFASSASCAGGGSGFEAPNGASDIGEPTDPDDDNDGVDDFTEIGRSSAVGSVWLFSGEYHLETTDLVVPGRGFDFVWRRYYRSRTGSFTPMGQNWDFSYNRRLVLSSGTVLLFGGSGRADVYSPSTTGCYTSTGSFRSLCPQPDGTWVMSMPSHVTWTFHALDGSPAQGRILSVQDPDSNTMSFGYDAAGRLTAITDTLGRPITVSYNADGLVSTVTDFGGHQVGYAYYSSLDLDGMPGDLASVTSPPITGTPNGNDFPAGRKTVYTYTRNTGQPALDHNLLTVRSPQGTDSTSPPAVLVRNLYSSTTNPANPGFDRLQRQVYADDPFTSSSYITVSTVPAEEPGAVRKTIVRDRLGNVRDVYFDSSNRAIALREYTGRAPSTSLPTDATTNRPGTPLRATDPPSFRTAFSYNADSLVTGVVRPRLDALSMTYDSSNTDVKQRANLLQRVWTPGPSGADQSSISQSWSYTAGYGTEPCPEGAVCSEGGTTERRLCAASLLANAYLCERTAGGGGGGGGGAGGEITAADAGRRRAGETAMAAVLYAVTRPARTGRNPQTGKFMNANVRSDTYLAPDRARPASPSPGHGTCSGGICYGIAGSPSDPDACETSGLCGNWTSYTDPDGRTWSQTIDPAGHVTQLSAPPVTIGQPAGSSQYLNDLWTYNLNGQVTSHTDPLGHVHTASYFTSGPQKGYLQSITVDESSSLPGGSLHFVEVYGVDEWGNTISVTDPNGNTESYDYNALGQLVRRTAPAPFSYVTDYRYDARGQLVRVDGDNRDETGAPRPRPKTFTNLTYDARGLPTSVQLDGTGSFDPNGGAKLTTELVYDAEGHLTLVRHPAAVSGQQPHDVTRYLVDERGLPFRTIEAEGDLVQRTTQLDYDADGGLAAIREGLESSPRVTTLVRDGYGRATQSTDPAGNVATLHYDASGRVVSSRLDGELTDGSGGPNVRLAESTATYDEVGRQVRLDRAFFDTTTGAPIGDGVSTSKVFYDERSQVVHTEDDDGFGPTLAYDGAGRLISTHDAMGSTVEYTYDSNDNVLTTTETEYSTNPGMPPAVFATTNVYDALDRRLSTSQAGVSYTFAWDSQADFPVVVTGGRGNVVRRDHDDAGRLVATHSTMTTDGTGTGATVFVLDATRSHDDGSRLLSETDDNGNTTSYTYDARGRKTATVNPDGTSETYLYSVHDDLLSWTDPNGTVVTSTYDALGRATARSIARAPGVLGTTSEVWKYDGLSRIVYGQNNDALVTRGYDSLSNLTRETSTIASDPGRNTNWIFTGGGALSSVTYPSGHNLGMSHDPCGRVTSMTSTGPGVCSGSVTHGFCTTPAECGGASCVPLSPATTSYVYQGPDRVVQRTQGNGTQTEIGYDALRRVNHVTLHTPLETIDERAFEWDADSNKITRTILSTPGAGSRHDYSYDSASRMIHSVDSRPGQAPVTVDYALDGAGNRTSVTGGTDAGSYPMSSAVPEPADNQMNQYTSTPWDGARAYDKSGNLVSRASGGSTLAYDYRGRLILVSGSGGTGSYAYDVFGRRVLADGKRLYYDGMEEAEERAATGALTRVSIHGPGRDPVIVVADIDTDGNPDRVFPHTDDLGNVVVVTNGSGSALERYDFGDYGRPRFQSPAGTTIPQSAIGNPFLFNGLRFDASTGLYDVHTRHLDPRAGRFVSRDTIGTWGDAGALGNATAFAGSNPWSGTDPDGTKVPRPVLKEYFQTGDKPTQSQFSDMIDSYVHQTDDGVLVLRYMFGLTGSALTEGMQGGDSSKLLNAGKPKFSVWASTNIGGRTAAGGSFSWTQVEGPFKLRRLEPRLVAAAASGEQRHVSNQEAYSNFVAVPDRARRRLVLVPGSFGAGSSYMKLCPGHISCPQLPPAIEKGTNPLGLSATRGIAVDIRL